MDVFVFVKIQEVIGMIKNAFVLVKNTISHLKVSLTQQSFSSLLTFLQTSEFIRTLTACTLLFKVFSRLN
jgi:hypothetical protein